jgi:microcystin-dependent protein
MAQPFVGEIRMVGFNFAPAGWELCDGRLLAIAENETLFNLIGTTYGGDGQSTFALPDLQGRAPLHSDGNNNIYPLALKDGVETVTLATTEMPVHNHAFVASTSGGTDPNPQNQTIGSPPTLTMFIVDNPVTALHAQSVSPVGGSQPHDNLQPMLVINFIISLFGIYPSPS